jgi:hypothetical protein
MAWYVVSYDLRKDTSKAAYDRIEAALRTATDWCKPLFSHWIIETKLTPRQIITELLRVGAIDDDDGIVILQTDLSGDFRRVSAAKNVVEWMRARINRF